MDYPLVLGLSQLAERGKRLPAPEGSVRKSSGNLPTYGRLISATLERAGDLTLDNLQSVATGAARIAPVRF